MLSPGGLATEFLDMGEDMKPPLLGKDCLVTTTAGDGCGKDFW